MPKIATICTVLLVGSIAFSSCKQEQDSMPTSVNTTETTPTPATPKMQEVTTDQLAPDRDRMGDYKRRLTDGKVTFKMTESRVSGTKFLRVKPTGLLGSNEEIVLTVEGDVKHAELADLDQDGHSEILFFTQSYDSNKSGQALGLASNNGVDLSEVVLPPISAYPQASDGYNGGDLYMIKDSRLLHKFPVHANGAPTGKYRTITYRMNTEGQERSFSIEKIEES